MKTKVDEVEAAPTAQVMRIPYHEVLARAEELLSSSFPPGTTAAPDEARRLLFRDCAALVVMRVRLIDELERKLGVKRAEAVDFTSQLAIASLNSLTKLGTVQQ